MEIERKYVVLNWHTSLTPAGSVRAHITQTYLFSVEDEERRVRRIIAEDGTTTYTRTTKRKTAVAGVREETEEIIDSTDYEEALRNRDPKLFPISKTRFTFIHNAQKFGLDVYDGRLQGINVLEIKLPNIDHPLSLPPQFVLREVTGRDEWSNKSLARKSRKNP